MLIDLDKGDMDIIVNNVPLYKFPEFRDKLFKHMQKEKMVPSPLPRDKDYGYDYGTDPITDLNVKLANMSMPDNPLDITDEQLKKMSKIISLGLMKSMAFSTALASPPPPPPQPQTEKIFLRIADRFDKTEMAIRNLSERMDRIQFATKKSKTPRPKIRQQQQ